MKNNAGHGGVKCEPGCTCRRHLGLGGSSAPRGPRREPLAPDTDKTCSRCKETKPVAQFSISRAATETRNAVYRPWCKACQSEAAKQWFRDNPDRVRTASRRRCVRAYGMTLEEYDALLAEQGGVCAICGNDEPEAHGRTGKKFELSVDHDHLTGRVRGLLCQRCNRAIGLLGDDVDLLKKAIYYLQKAGALWPPKSPDWGGQHSTWVTRPTRARTAATR